MLIYEVLYEVVDLNKCILRIAQSPIKSGGGALLSSFLGNLRLDIDRLFESLPRRII